MRPLSRKKAEGDWRIQVRDKGSLNEMAVLAAEGMVFGWEVGEDCLVRRWALSEKRGGVKSGKRA